MNKLQVLKDFLKDKPLWLKIFVAFLVGAFIFVSSYGCSLKTFFQADNVTKTIDLYIKE